MAWHEDGCGILSPDQKLVRPRRAQIEMLMKALPPDSPAKLEERAAGIIGEFWWMVAERKRDALLARTSMADQTLAVNDSRTEAGGSSPGRPGRPRGARAVAHRHKVEQPKQRKPLLIIRTAIGPKTFILAGPIPRFKRPVRLPHRTSYRAAFGGPTFDRPALRRFCMLMRAGAFTPEWRSGFNPPGHYDVVPALGMTELLEFFLAAADPHMPPCPTQGQKQAFNAAARLALKQAGVGGDVQGDSFKKQMKAARGNLAGRRAPHTL